MYLFLSQQYSPAWLLIQSKKHGSEELLFRIEHQWKLSLVKQPNNSLRKIDFLRLFSIYLNPKDFDYQHLTESHFRFSLVINSNRILLHYVFFKKLGWFSRK